METNCSSGDTLSLVQPSGLSINVSAPGKVILHGEHSVVYGKLAIAASLGLRTKLKLVETEGDNIELICSTINFRHSFNLEKDLKQLLIEPLPLNCLPEVFSWEHPESLHQEALLDKIDEFIGTTLSDLNSIQNNSIRAIFFLIAGILGSTNVHISPFLFDLKSDLNIGAGTGSSASFLVTIAAGFIQYVKAKKKSENFSKTGYKESNWQVDLKEFSNNELEMISSWAFAAEKIFHGMPSGIDNTICTHGSLVEFRKGCTPQLISNISPMKIILINTNIPRETKNQLKKVTKFHNSYPDLVNNILNAMEEVAFIALKYIELLNKEILPAFEISKIYQELGNLISVNHNLLKALDVSHLRLDEAVLILANHGLCGKLTGAGGGGYAFALVPPQFDEDSYEKAVQELVQKGFGVASTILGGKGVTVD